MKCNYYEGSAKTGENIEILMQEIARITYLEWKNNDEDKDTIRLSTKSYNSSVNHNNNRCCKPGWNNKIKNDIFWSFWYIYI